MVDANTVSVFSCLVLTLLFFLPKQPIKVAIVIWFAHVLVNILALQLSRTPSSETFYSATFGFGLFFVLYSNAVDNNVFWIRVWAVLFLPLVGISYLLLPGEGGFIFRLLLSLFYISAGGLLNRRRN